MCGRDFTTHGSDLLSSSSSSQSRWDRCVALLKRHLSTILPPAISHAHCLQTSYSSTLGTHQCRKQKLTAQLPRLREVDSYESRWFSSDDLLEGGPHGQGLLDFVALTGTPNPGVGFVARTPPCVGKTAGYYTSPPKRPCSSPHRLLATGRVTDYMV
jgi:hypothetical protein